MTLLDREFSADDIEAVTNGAASKTWLQNRSARDHWFTPLREPGQGRPRVYSFAHVMEAAITIELGKIGFSKDECRAVIRHRLLGATKRAGGYVRDLEAEFVNLPDLQSDDCIWAICHPATLPFKRSATLAELMERFAPAAGLKILDVGSVARAVRSKLEARASERPTSSRQAEVA